MRWEILNYDETLRLFGSYYKSQGHNKLNLWSMDRVNIFKMLRKCVILNILVALFIPYRNQHA